MSDTTALLQAAELLERIADQTTPGSWRTADYPFGRVGVDSPAGDVIAPFGEDAGGDAIRAADAAWVAAMGPADIGGPLAAMLRYEAGSDGTAHRGKLTALAHRLLARMPQPEQPR